LWLSAAGFDSDAACQALADTLWYTASNAGTINTTEDAWRSRRDKRQEKRCHSNGCANAALKADRRLWPPTAFSTTKASSTASAISARDPRDRTAS
jgi:hypothetical protein